MPCSLFLCLLCLSSFTDSMCLRFDLYCVLQALVREKQLSGKLKRVFALMDVDGDGKISLDDLITITEQLGYKIKPVSAVLLARRISRGRVSSGQE